MKKYFIGILSFALSISLITFLISKINLSNLIKSIVNCNPQYYVVSIVLYFSVLLLRTVRTKLFFNKINYSSLLIIICIHNLLNRVIPFRMGEAVLPIMLKKRMNIPIIDGINAIFSMRLLDLFVSIFFFFIVFLSIGITGQRNLFITCTLLIICTGLIIYFKKIVKFCIKTINNLLNNKYLKILIQTQPKENIFNSIDHKYNKILFLTFFDKIIWLIFSITVIMGLNYDLTNKEIIFANISSGFTEILPINSFGNFGTLELGWAGALMYFGVPTEIAIESGFSLNLMAFSIAIIIGLIAMFILCIFNKHYVNEKL